MLQPPSPEFNPHNMVAGAVIPHIQTKTSIKLSKRSLPRKLSSTNHLPIPTGEQPARFSAVIFSAFCPDFLREADTLCWATVACRMEPLEVLPCCDVAGRALRSFPTWLSLAGLVSRIHRAVVRERIPFPAPRYSMH